MPAPTKTWRQHASQAKMRQFIRLIFEEPILSSNLEDYLVDHDIVPENFIDAPNLRILDAWMCTTNVTHPLHKTQSQLKQLWRTVYEHDDTDDEEDDPIEDDEDPIEDRPQSMPFRKRKRASDDSSSMHSQQRTLKRARSTVKSVLPKTRPRLGSTPQGDDVETQFKSYWQQLKDLEEYQVRTDTKRADIVDRIIDTQSHLQKDKSLPPTYRVKTRFLACLVSNLLPQKFPVEIYAKSRFQLETVLDMIALQYGLQYGHRNGRCVTRYNIYEECSATYQFPDVYNIQRTRICSRVYH